MVWVITLCLRSYPYRLQLRKNLQNRPPRRPEQSQTLPDTLLPQITTAIQGVTTPDVNALRNALHIGEPRKATGPSTPADTVVPVGDLDGDGVPEVLLK